MNAGRAEHRASPTGGRQIPAITRPPLPPQYVFDRMKAELPEMLEVWLEEYDAYQRSCEHTAPGQDREPRTEEAP